VSEVLFEKLEDWTNLISQTKLSLQIQVQS